MKLYKIVFQAFIGLVIATTTVSAQIPATLGWYEIPNTKIAPVCPQVSGIGSCDAVILAWNSGIADTKRNRHIIWGGGHSDYFGNEVYALDLNTLALTRLNSPGSFSNVGSCPETYSDGTPSARHTYDGLAYIASADKMFAFGGSKSNCGNFTNAAWAFNLASPAWQNLNPSGNSLYGGPGAIAEYDINTGKVIVADTGSLWAYTPSSNSYAQLTNSAALDYHLSGVIDSDRKLFIAVGGGQFRAFNIAGASTTMQNWDSQVSNCNGLRNSDSPGLAYDTVQHKVIGWTGGASVYIFDPDTKSCVISSPSGTNPGAAPSQGINGHFQYFPALNIFTVVNSINQNAFSLRLTNGTVTPPPVTDTTAPVTSITSPSNGSTVSGAITITASASDNTGVAGVQFRLDGANLGSEDTSSPYTITFNTTTVSNTAHSITSLARDAAGNTATSAAVSITVNNTVVTPPPSTSTGYPMPTLADEKATYTRWGWTWSTSLEPNYSSASGYNVSDPDIHGDTEGDDLWTYLQMYKRTNQQGYLQRSTAWANYFKNGYRACTGQQYRNFCYDRDAFGADHMYGWGLVALFEYNGDSAALTEAENLGSVLETLYSASSPFGCLPNNACMHYGLRQVGRHLNLMSRLAEVTGKARWITLRDKILTLVMNNSQWDTRGMYFWGNDNTDTVQAGLYATGTRIISPFELGQFAEGMFQAARTTGRADIKARIVAMARFVNQYGLDSTAQYTGYRFGVTASSQAVHYETNNPVYTTDLVDLLVMGYKYSGDPALLAKAKVFFNRGTKGQYGTGARLASDTAVHHFVDTIFDTSSGNFYLDYNKGELQYTYLIFENGGLPSIDGSSPPPVTDNIPPIITITSPAAGQVSGTITIAATASDNVGVSGVQFKVDNSNSGQEDTTVPYQLVFNTTALTNGNHTFLAAARDAAGNTASASVVLAVNNIVLPPPDTQSPVITITGPANGSTVSGANVAISANVTDNVGVAGVQFKIDGVNYAAEDLNAPYLVNVDTTTLVNGAHAIAVVARDAAGNIGNSAPWSVTVNNVVTPPPPSTSPTTPTGLALVAITSTSVNLSWQSNDVGTIFIIERRVSPTGTYIQIGETGNKTYSDSDWVHGHTRYYYRVRSSVGNTISGTSNVLAVTTP